VTRLPTTASELESTLVGFFPTFATELAKVEPDPSEFGERTLHSVLLDFAPYFARHAESFSERQLEGFGQFLSAALQTGGHLENALSTCFLEHAHQLKVNKKLRHIIRKAQRPT
jgi:hypothetical protein